MIVPLAVSALGAGLVFGLSLIVAIGAQNTYVLRQGLRREHVVTVVAICTGSDVALIAAGVAGASAALHGRHWLLSGVRFGGAAFLFAFAALALWRSLRATTASDEPAAAASSLTGVVAACLAFTWLNPAVYLDTVVLLGSVANTRPGHQWWFAAGAGVASVLWFAGLGFGARWLTPLFRRPGAWRLLDLFVSLVMASTGVRVLLSAP